MTKKMITRALIASALCIGVVVAASIDPDARLAGVRDLFTKYGADTFKILNEQGIGGTSTSEGSGKGSVVQAGDISSIINSTDGHAFVGCVQDGKWAVYPPEPMKIGTDAMTMTDDTGKPFVSSIITALRAAPDGKAHRVPYTLKTPDGQIEKREVTAWNSRNLLSRKNDTGKKFFCFTSVKASPYTEEPARTKRAKRS